VRRLEKQCGVWTSYLNNQIDAIHERSADARTVPIDLRRIASTRSCGITKKAAGARIRRAYQCEERREPHSPLRADQCHCTVLDRLTQTLQGSGPELRHLIEEQDAVMCKRCLSGSGRATPSHETGD
jgi:hypothetical protein